MTKSRLALPRKINLDFPHDDESSSDSSTWSTSRIRNLDIQRSFPSFETALSAIEKQQAEFGYCVRKDWSKQGPEPDKLVMKYIFRCSSYGNPVPRHNVDLDPANHRKGRSARTGCMAHWNAIRKDSSPDSPIVITLVQDTHNHPPPVPESGTIPQKPTDQHKKVVQRLAEQNFTRGQIKTILDDEFHWSPGRSQTC